MTREQNSMCALRCNCDRPSGEYVCGEKLMSTRINALHFDFEPLWPLLRLPGRAKEELELRQRGS